LADNTAPLRGNLSFALEVVGDGEKGRRFTVPVRIRTFGTVAISQKQLPKHAPITDDDLLFRSVETTTLSTDVITKREQLIGKRTKRIVSEGSVLSESVFESHPLVELNQFVTLMVRHGAVALSTKAVAKEDGRKGDIITVQLVDSHQRLRARVIDDQTLELVPK
jgi:flagella basal body P-ring formation protein FlgA